MASDPFQSRRQIQQQNSPFNGKIEEKITALKQSSDLKQRQHNDELQKMIRRLLLCVACLSIIVIIVFYFLLFGFSADTLRLLIPSVLANLITVLFIYIFTEMILQSLKKYSTQRDELEQVEIIVPEEKLDKKLEPVIMEVAITSTKVSNMERHTKKQEKENANMKRIQDMRISNLEKENVTLRKRVEAIEDYLTLPH